MKNCRLPWSTAVALSVHLLLGGALVVAQQDKYEDDAEFVLSMAAHVGPCSTHAGLLKLACGADRRDDYLVHLADCAYLVEASEQASCRSQARAERNEKRSECADVYEARLEICELVGEQRSVFPLGADDFEAPGEIGDSVAPNPYWSLVAGDTRVIVGEGEVTVVYVTDDVREVGGLPCRVVTDLVFEEEFDDEEGEYEYDAVEVTQDWYAQSMSGDVYYCGENSYEVEDGLVDNTDGSFAHRRDRAQAGLLIAAMPVVGEGQRQELATDEAEDYSRTESLAASPSADEGGEGAVACDGACLQTFEANPHDPGEAEYKYYLPGSGFVLATKLEDGEPNGEREEVACIGDSLDVLDDPACGIADVEELREELCEWSPEYFCDDEDDDPNDE